MASQDELYEQSADREAYLVCQQAAAASRFNAAHMARGSSVADVIVIIATSAADKAR